MSRGFEGASSFGERHGFGEEPWRAIVLAFAIAATSVCLGGALAVAAVSRGASTGASVSIMSAVLLLGVVVAIVVVRHTWQPDDLGIELPRSRGLRRADRAHRRAIRRAERMDPTVLLEQQLSARYGVPVQRLAGHVWRVNGELVEATFDPATGQLICGGRELSL
jgi:hypothetical protein